MAHFAELDENNVVTQVIVVHNNELLESKQTTLTEDGTVSVSYVESEQLGIDFCKSLHGADTRWVQTSYNGSFRGKYAGIGDTYENGAFVAPEVLVVEAPVEEVAQVSCEVSTLSSVDIPTLSSSDVATIASADVAPLTSTDIPALTTSDLSVMTTSDISSLG
jgi:hypothetical protein